MKKNIWIIVALIVVVGASWFLYQKMTNQADDNAAITDATLGQVTIGYKVESINSGPLIIAYRNGYLAAHGLDVELIPSAASEELVIALSTRQVDIGAGSIGHFISTIDEGAPLRLTGFFVLTQAHPMVRADSGIATLADLQGKTILSHGGNASDITLLQALRSQNIDADTMTFEIIEDRSVELLALMEQQIVDATMVTQREVTDYEEAGAIILPEWADSTTINKFAPGVVAMNNDFLATSPELAEAFNAAYIEAYQYIIENPKQAATDLARYIEEDSDGATLLTVEEILAMWNSGEVKFAVWDDPANVEGIAQEMYDSGLLENDLSADDLFDWRFRASLEQAQADAEN